VEWDNHCRSVLNYHWADVPKWGDIKNVDGGFLPPVDCIIFGSPCQDLSISGKRKGLEGERSGLFYEATRIIKEMRNATGNVYPRYSIWENVRGALSSNFGRDFTAVLHALGEAGAHLSEYCLLDSQNFGVPQVRNRVFVISIYDFAAAKRSPDEIFYYSNSMSKHIEKNNNAQLDRNETLRQSIERNDPASEQTKVSEWWNGKQVVETLLTNPSFMPDKSKLFVLVETNCKAENELTLRRLTPLECERLQGYPDDHTRWRADGTEQGLTQRYKQTGNGVTTPVAKYVAEQLLNVHQQTYPVTPLSNS
jgi:DNA (cytosine-5)-methyltransferase 1